MTEDQYKKLCAACDALLLDPDAGNARVATGWLHVLREHPLLLTRYEMLFARNRVRILKWRSELLFKKFRYLVSYLKSLYHAWRWQGDPWWLSSPINEPLTIVFVSHLLNSRLAGSGDDFYFGSLPASLSANGVRVAIILINHTTEDGDELSRKWKSDPVPRIVLANTLTPSTEIEIQKQLRKESRLLAIENENNTELLHIRTRQQASVEVLSGATRVALRQSLQFRLLMKTLRPRFLLTTHEGHAWERLAYAAAHEAAPSEIASETQCIGYIQGALSRLQHAVRRNLAEAFNPDLILTAGAIGKAQMAGLEVSHRIPVVELGSNRWIKATSITHQTRGMHAEKPGCLVVPEGLMEECCRLFSFSLDCALALPSVNFIWRLHPLITFDMLRKAERRFNSLPGNIILSGIKIEEDIVRSRWALYRGSTAIIQCGAAGLRPIYLNRPDELPFDALYELQEWRREVSTVEDFYRIVQSDCGADEQALYREAQSAVEYISSIYTRLNPEVLKNIVAAHGI